MYLIMNDKSFIGTRGGEIEEGILKYVEIPDDLLEQLDFSFIENFKTILRANEFKNIKHRKREPKLENKLDFFVWVKKDRSSIPFFDYSIWDKDIKKILKYFDREKEEMNNSTDFLTFAKKNKRAIIQDIKGANLSLKEYYLILLPFLSEMNDEEIFFQKNFLEKTMREFYNENFNDNETNIGNYAHLMIDYKIKLLSNNSQIFLSVIFRPIFPFSKNLDEALNELEKCLIHHKLLSKKQIKASN